MGVGQHFLGGVWDSINPVHVQWSFLAFIGMLTRTLPPYWLCLASHSVLLRDRKKADWLQHREIYITSSHAITIYNKCCAAIWKCIKVTVFKNEHIQITREWDVSVFPRRSCMMQAPKQTDLHAWGPGQHIKIDALENQWFLFKPKICI